MHNIPEISPTNVRDYVRALGWHFVSEATRDGLFVLNHPSNAFIQLVLPIDNEAPDYFDAIRNVISKIVEFEKTSSERVIENLIDVEADKLRFRLFRTGGGLDSIPMSLGASMLDGIKRVIMSAACSVQRVRPHHSRLSGTIAEQFLAACKMGHTEQGSFIWKVSCPLDAVRLNEGQGALNFDAPFARRVTETAMLGMSNLHRAIISDDVAGLVARVNASDVTDPTGVTSNLCDGLLNLIDASMGNNLEVIPSWSPRRPLPVSERFPHSVRFLREHAARIEEIQRALTPGQEEDASSFVGTVEKLEGEMNEDGNREGYVVMSLLLAETGETLRARVFLNHHDHAIAIRAYEQEGMYVRVSGILLPGRQPRTLSSPTGFALLEETAPERPPQ